MKSLAEIMAEGEASAPRSPIRSLADIMAEGEAPVAAEHEEPPAAAPEQDNKGNVPAMFNVKDAIAETMAQPLTKPPLQGETPRLAAPDDERILLDRLANAAPIVNLVNKLGLDTIAEGVETDDQLNIIQRINCKTIQGFLTGKPMSKNDCEKMIQDEFYTIG